MRKITWAASAATLCAVVVLGFCLLFLADAAPAFAPSYYDATAGADAPSAAVPASWKPAAGEAEADIVITRAYAWASAPRDAGARVVEDEYWVLPAGWDDFKPDARFDDTAASDTPSAGGPDGLEPLSAVRLPRKALPWRGLLPGDEGYPWRRLGTVSAKAGGLLSRCAALKWLESLPEAAEPEGLSWLGAVGDVMPGRGTSALLLGENGPARVFRRLLPVMRAQDLLVGNLETAVTERGVEWPKTFRFRMPPSAVPALMDSGFDLVGLANNHVFDFTETGFDDTLASLKAAGLPFVGAGATWDEATRPYETTLGGRAVAVWALGAFPVERTGFYGLEHASIQRGKPGLLWADEAALGALGAAFSERPDALKIVVAHAGLEYTPSPYAVQEKLYRRLVDMGADVILGHHPHVLQPMEWYRGPERSGLIAYSLGNFVFDGVEDNPAAMDAVLLSLGVQGGAVRAVRAYGSTMDGAAVDLAADDSVVDRLAALTAAWEARQAR